ncbi:MAG TPA: phage baseplate assembly protein [Kaistia sp.]|nr:phage baseplate assembly protein [Kaistia sp.]
MRMTQRDAGRRALLGASRGVVKAVSSRAKQQKLQHLDIEAFGGETHEGAEHVEAYGFAAKPHAGAEAFVVYLGGNRNHPIVISVADRQFRPQGLADGEVIFYDDLGQSVHLTRAGIVVTAPTITLNGNVVVNGDLTITGGSVTNDGVNIGSTHRHSGVTPGTGNTGTPV